jgi:hypothetical protein
LLRLVFLHWHVQLSFRVSFSHSRWTNSSQSRHGDARFPVVVVNTLSKVTVTQILLDQHDFLPSRRRLVSSA